MCSAKQQHESVKTLKENKSKIQKKYRTKEEYSAYSKVYDLTLCGYFHVFSF